jgi:hypothetical protein
MELKTAGTEAEENALLLQSVMQVLTILVQKGFRMVARKMLPPSAPPPVP